MHRQIPLIAKWAGFSKIGEKVVEHRARKYGVTKFGLNRFINGFLDLFTIVFTQKYLKKPMHFFGTWGILFAALGGFTLTYLAFIRLILGEGIGHRIPALMFGSVTLLLGFILFSTGLLGEMISRTDPGRNQYRISERIGVGKIEISVITDLFPHGTDAICAYKEPLDCRPRWHLRPEAMGNLPKDY